MEIFMKKNLLIFLVLSIISLNAMGMMNQNTMMNQLVQIWKNHNVVSGTSYPAVGTDGSLNFEGRTENGDLVKVRFNSNGILDNNYGDNGIEIIKNVGTDYEVQFPTEKSRLP
jgi:hypothetical protein